jgi:hypothetical protein
LAGETLGLDGKVLRGSYQLDFGKFSPFQLNFTP